jgi:hypothetical protein
VRWFGLLELSRRIGISLALFGVLAVPVHPQARPPSVGVAVSATEIFRGEPLTFQVIIEGSDGVDSTPAPPGGEDFDGRLLNAGPSNSQSITIINGRESRQVRLRYLITYELLAKRSGQLVVPSMQIAVAGHSLETRSVGVLVREPEPVEEYQLLLEVDHDSLWLGESMTVATLWLWRPDLGPTRLSSFSHPILRADDIVAAQIQPDPADPDALVRLTVNGDEIIAIRDSRVIEGERFVGLRLDSLLTPRHAGRMEVPAAVVAFDGIAGFREGQDLFGRSTRRQVSRTYVVPSNQLVVNVRELPTAGRPTAFGGLTGVFSLVAAASPTSVKVGDPIDVTFTLSGRGNLHAFAFPDLATQPGYADFRVGDSSPGDQPVAGGATERVFRRTLRAGHGSVSALPALRIAVFDTALGAYAELVSEPIPLDVAEARGVTLADVEGGGAVAPRRDVQATVQGIAHNYAPTAALLSDHRFDLQTFAGSAAGLTSLLVLPGAFLAVLGVGAARRSVARRRGTKPRSALGRLRGALLAAAPASGTGPEEPFNALRRFVAERLQLASPVADTLGAEQALVAAGVGAGRIAALRQLYAESEQQRYGGTGAGPAAPPTDLLVRVAAWAEAIDGDLTERPHRRRRRSPRVQGSA